jgi:hypothetical protein
MLNTSNILAVERPPPTSGNVHLAVTTQITALITEKPTNQPIAGENHGC